MCLSAERGFFASICRSITRFADIPTVLALTIATVIHANTGQPGKPSPPVWTSASTMPIYANGSANTLSWNLIASRNIGALRHSGLAWASAVRIRTPSSVGQPGS